MPPPAPVSAMVRVRLFASLRDALGWSERQVPLPDQRPCTPMHLWTLLAPASPPSPATVPPSAAPALPAGVRVAINQRFASPDTPLQAGDELAFLPPITGG